MLAPVPAKRPAVHDSQVVRSASNLPAVQVWHVNLSCLMLPELHMVQVPALAALQPVRINLLGHGAQLLHVLCMASSWNMLPSLHSVSMFEPSHL
jgi:hypothetical protein